MQHIYSDKNQPKIWASSLIFVKLPKENNHPRGKNSPNLVTLLSPFQFL
jgi:hypothetical protein